MWNYQFHIECVIIAAARRWRAFDREKLRPETHVIDHDNAGDRPQSASTPSSRRQRRIIDVVDLLGPENEAILVHKGEDYRLRITSKGRLILTK
ncbi:MAG: hemin uptake protein HemP [Pseudomonadota bacterium]